MKKSLQLTLANVSDDDANILRNAVTAIRDAGQQMQTCIASLSDFLEEPLKSKFADIKNKVNTMLAGLPATDMVPAATASNNILQQLLGVMSTAQLMMNSLSEATRSAKSDLQATRASLTAEVTKEIDARISSGELVKKEDIEPRIQDATKTARAGFEEEMKLRNGRIEEHKLMLTTAKLILPGEDILGKTDEEFAPLKLQAEKRAAELKPFSLPEDRMVTLCWKADDAAYGDALGLAKTLVKQPLGMQPNGFGKRIEGTPGAATPKKLGLF